MVIKLKFLVFTMITPLCKTDLILRQVWKEIMLREDKCMKLTANKNLLYINLGLYYGKNYFIEHRTVCLTTNET